MGFTTPTEIEEDFYERHYENLVIALVKKDKFSKKLFLSGCIDGAILATKAIPPFKSSTLNKFEPMYIGDSNNLLSEQEYDAMLGNAVIKPYSTGYCIGFLTEAFVRADGILFSDAFASHTQKIAEIISLTPKEILTRDVFYKLARDIHFHLEYKSTLARRDVFIETLLK